MSNSVVKINAKRTKFIRAAQEFLGDDRKNISRTEIQYVQDEYGLPRPYWLMKLKESRGIYYLPNLQGVYGGIDLKSSINTVSPPPSVEAAVVQMAPSALGVMDQQETYVPAKIDG